MKKKHNYWDTFFLLASLEGGFALFKLLNIPTDPNNSVFLGLSASRLLMVAILLGTTILFLWLAFISKKKKYWSEKYLNPEEFPKTLVSSQKIGVIQLPYIFSPQRAQRPLSFSLYKKSLSALCDLCGKCLLTIPRKFEKIQTLPLLNWISFLGALFAAIALFLLRYYDPVKFLPLFERAKDLTFFIILVGFQLSLCLLLFRKGFELKKIRNKAFFQTTGILFIIFLALFAFITLSRVGLTPDTAYWAEPGIALQGWQFALALILGFLGFSLGTKLSSQKSDLFIALLIWGIAIAIWWSVPMDVLKNSFYAPFAYPLGKALPYSDAGFYDYLSQGLLLGNGFLAQIPPRPLYIVFLTGLRTLVGINNYDQIMFGQTLVIALFPVILYFIGKTLHSRAAGITIAFLGIFREWTNLLVSSQTRVSNSRMTLTDLPTALVLSLLALVIIFWLKKRDASPLSPLLAGGTFGVLLLLRTQSMLILPFILLLALLIFFPNWKKWSVAVVIFIIGVALSISPWLTRNAQITGKITFDDPQQLAVLASQYKTSGNLNWTDFDYENESLSNSILGFALQNPAYVANFVATHFFATEINGLLVLPLIKPFNGFQEPINTYWVDWDGHLSLANQLLLIFYLAIIALGIAASWKKLKWVALVPLAINLGYALSNGVARFSGWRYDLPADWVAYFYFGIGFIECIAIFASAFGVNREKKDENSSILRTPRFVLLKSLLFSFLFLLIGFSPLLLEEKIPSHFELLTESQLIAKISPSFAEIEPFIAQEDARVLMGRLIYPRFYRATAGLASAHPWPAYAPRDFSRMGFLVLNEKNTQVAFPVKNIPAEFPNGVDVIILGCQKSGFVEARLLYIMDEKKTLISEKGFISCVE